MKYVWIAMVIIPYLIWAYVSIKDVIKEWKKRDKECDIFYWIAHVLEPEDSTTYFFGITLFVIFVISFAMWVKSVFGG